VDSLAAAPLQDPSGHTADAGCAEGDSTHQGQDKQQAEKPPEQAAACRQSDAVPPSTTAAAAAAAPSGWQGSKDAKDEIERIKQLWAQQAAAEQEQEQQQQQAWGHQCRGKESRVGAAADGNTGQGSQQQQPRRQPLPQADPAHKKTADSTAGQPHTAPPSQIPSMDPTEEKLRIKQLWQAEAAAAELKTPGRRHPHAQQPGSPLAASLAAAARDRAGADRLRSGRAAREMGAAPAPAAAPFQQRGSAAASDGGSQWEQSGVHTAHRQSTESDYYTHTITSDSIRSSSSSSHQPGRYSDPFSNATMQQAAGQMAHTSAFSTAAGSAAAADPSSGAGATCPASASNSAYGSYAQGYTDQPAPLSYTSSMPGPAISSAAAAAAAAEGPVGEDSNDDVPPGFENISRPPGFEGREPARAAAIAAAGLARMPPGFDGRALRVRATMASHPKLQHSTSLGRDEQHVAVCQQVAQQPLQNRTSLSRSGQHVAVSQRLAARLGGQPLDETDRPSQPVQHSASLGGSEQRVQLSQRLAARLGGQPIDEADRFSQTVQVEALQATAATAAADAAGRGLQQTRRFLFAGGPVCRECGAAGHEEADCSTPLCERCNLVSTGSSGTCSHHGVATLACAAHSAFLAHHHGDPRKHFQSLLFCASLSYSTATRQQDMQQSQPCLCLSVCAAVWAF
jgi:hypothetical protein